MNPTKFLDEVVTTIGRYASTIVVHLFLLVWLGVRVLSSEQLPRTDAVWVTLAKRIDTSLTAMGLPLQRWHVIIAVTIAYLIAFQWLRNVVISLRPFQVPFPQRLNPTLVYEAARVFRIRPSDFPKIRVELYDRIDELNRELSEAGSVHPYQWRFDRVKEWYAYYGTVLVTLAFSIIWLVEGSSYARSTGRVWELVSLLGAACVFLRWKTKHEIATREVELGFWALRQSEQSTPRNMELEWKRRELLKNQVAFDRAIANHAAQRLWLLAHRWLPNRWGTWVQDRLQRPHWWSPGADWDIFESAASKHGDVQHPSPKALSPDPFVTRFEALLECTGAGLAVLAPQSQGLAPSVHQGGASFCLATRRHGGHVLPITLQAADDLSLARLVVSTRPGSTVFLVEVGEYPIARLAQFDFPSDHLWVWSRLNRAELDSQVWAQLDDRQPVQLDHLTLSDNVQLRLGSSYLLGAKTELNTRVSAAFQCFRVANSSKVLVAWRILHAAPEELLMPKVAPWWTWAGWKGLIRRRPSGPGSTRLR